MWLLLVQLPPTRHPVSMTRSAARAGTDRCGLVLVAGVGYDVTCRNGFPPAPGSVPYRRIWSVDP
jgi:hypothetical protein